MKTTFERLAEIVAKDYPQPKQAVTLDTPLEALGIDSLGMVELLWQIEDSFQIKLPNELVKLQTLGDVVCYVDQLVAGQVPAGLPLTLPLPMSTAQPIAQPMPCR